MKRIIRAAAATAATLFAAQVGAAVVISYPDFSSVAGLTINGNAAQVGSVLRVTPANFNQAGSAFSTSTVSLASGSSFSTYFQFRFTSAGGSCDSPTTCGADGLVFVVQTVGNNVGGLGGGIGYQGIANSLGIEFDTWNNGAIDGGSSNHAGINLAGDVNSVARTEVTEADMNGGDVWNAWVDYDSTAGTNGLLEVRLTRSAARPAAALLNYDVNLSAVLGTTNAFVGFTSGTGAAFANHDVLSWQLNDNFSPIGTTPEPTALALLGLGLAGLAELRGFAGSTLGK